ncbi:MAG TPA: chemotaxis protein MotB, partial [Epsilonproteobacteria bacterium]|nr:chemotaxis protein MotB [Campylobacterota bacterium]
MSAQSNAPIIIKKVKKVSGGGHHGGAWKVAYADFVTAMMACFMLMWLLNATTEKQRKGIADYCSPTIPIMRASGGGDGAFGGDSVFTSETLAHSGTGGIDRAMSADSAQTNA